MGEPVQLDKPAGERMLAAREKELNERGDGLTDEIFWREGRREREAGKINRRGVGRRKKCTGEKEREERRKTKRTLSGGQ